MAGAQEARDGDGDGDGDVVHGSRGGPRQQARVLVFPLPFQGHIDPMLHLAGVLHARGLAVTVLHTRFNALDASRHPEFQFVAVPDGTPADVAATGRIIDIILAMNEAMEASPAAVGEALASAAAPAEDQQGRQPRASCLFIDANLLAVQRAARALGLRTGSAACFGCFLAYPMLHEKGYLPPQESQLCMPVPELPPLRVKDLVYSKHSDHELVRRVLARASETVRGCSGLVINTCEALEAAEIGRLRDELADLPVVLAAGPLHKLSPSRGTGSSLLAPDRSCVEWLDGQRSGSVLYVSFGSLAAMDSDEFQELAWGLAESGHPFLWVVRPNQVRGCDDDESARRLPDGFEDAVGGRGRGVVVRWAPQQEVLAHRAVGGFWSHCGWNSTLEGISEGVPMICRPDAVDQMMNVRGSPKKRKKATKTAQSSIVPLEDEAPARSMTFPPSQNLEPDLQLVRRERAVTPILDHQKAQAWKLQVGNRESVVPSTLKHQKGQEVVRINLNHFPLSFLQPQINKKLLSH